MHGVGKALSGPRLATADCRKYAQRVPANDKNPAPYRLAWSKQKSAEAAGQGRALGLWKRAAAARRGWCGRAQIGERSGQNREERVLAVSPKSRGHWPPAPYRLASSKQKSAGQQGISPSQPVEIQADPFLSCLLHHMSPPTTITDSRKRPPRGAPEEALVGLPCKLHAAG